MSTIGNLKFLLVGFVLICAVAFVLIAVAFVELLTHRQAQQAQQVAFDRFKLRLFQTAVSLRLDQEEVVDGSSFPGEALEFAKKDLENRAKSGGQWYTV
jgi:hypothetical protein